MRELISKYGAYFIAFCLLIAVLVFYFHVKGGGGTPTTALAFYVDENNLKDETVKSATEIPPLNNKDGKPTLVQAVKRSCDPTGKNPYIAYLRKMTPESQAQLRAITDPTDLRAPQLMQSGMLVRSPTPGSEWVKAASPEGEKLIVVAPCPDGRLPITVFPRR